MIDAIAELDNRANQRVHDMLARWSDEAAEASVNSNPMRGFYLEHITRRVPVILREQVQARQLAEQERRELENRAGLRR